MKTIKEIKEHIVKRKNGYYLISKSTGKPLGGPYPSEAGAKKRERQVQYFKHMGEEQINEIDRGDWELQRQVPKKHNPDKEKASNKLHHKGLELVPDEPESRGQDPYNRNPFKQFREELIGLTRPKGRFAANITHKKDPETGQMVPDKYRAWVPPTGGREGKSGRETWAVQQTIDQRNKRLGVGAEKKPETPKSIKKTATGSGTLKNYLTARPPRG